MRGKTARRTIVLASVAALALAAAGCASSERDDDSGGGGGTAASSKDTLVFGAAGDPKLFDPAFASDGETFRVLQQIYESLVSTEAGRRRDRAGAGREVGGATPPAPSGRSPCARA